MSANEPMCLGCGGGPLPRDWSYCCEDCARAAYDDDDDYASYEISFSSPPHQSRRPAPAVPIRFPNSVATIPAAPPPPNRLFQRPYDDYDERMSSPPPPPRGPRYTPGYNDSLMPPRRPRRPPRICPTCQEMTVTPGFDHCSRECALGMCPTCGENPITPGYKHCSRNCALGLCPICEENPINPGYEHCSRECAQRSRPEPAATPRKQIKICEYCEKKNADPPYRYCSRECARKHAKEKGAAEAAGGDAKKAQPVYRLCAMRGCTKAEFKPGTKYCGDRHRHEAVEKKLEPACLYCRQYPKMDRSAFCGPSCAADAEGEAPLLLSVPKDDPTYALVDKQFTNEWKHTSTPPTVISVYRIVITAALNAPFQAKKKEIEDRGHFKAEGLLPANERYRWHGTKRSCLVGDPGEPSLALCTSSSCSVCTIIRSSFDVTKCRSGCMFGTGVYTSGTSSKSDLYVRQSSSPSTKYRAMILSRVLAGNAKKLTEADQTLNTAPQGFDSVRGVPGGTEPGVSLKYDELIVYSNDQIRPVYLVIYEKQET